MAGLGEVGIDRVHTGRILRERRRRNEKQSGEKESVHGKR
jgi:hypothetical protein